MIGEITPLVKVAGVRTWAGAALAHTAGGAISAGALGFLLGVAGLLAGAGAWPWKPFVGAMLLICAVQASGLLRFRVPSSSRQTPRWFKVAYGPIAASFGWGLDLGLGWTTRIASPAYYVLLLFAVAIADPLSSAVGMMCFGLGRGLPVVLNGLLAISFNDGNLFYPYEEAARFAPLVSLLLFALAGSLFLTG